MTAAMSPRQQTTKKWALSGTDLVFSSTDRFVLGVLGDLGRFFPVLQPGPSASLGCTRTVGCTAVEELDLLRFATGAVLGEKTVCCTVVEELDLFATGPVPGGSLRLMQPGTYGSAPCFRTPAWIAFLKIANSFL